ncbi:conserved hypothetical protein [metagenome]|uniref:2-C-methyl-D-erythritol 4-phosphate cytidylyltransferase n=1 Tax=metagenome TaxID=256318 RepID=A0A2P2C0C1_9ZZZZ
MTVTGRKGLSRTNRARAYGEPVTLIDPYGGEDLPPALGTVVDQDRGSLPYALIHGESLVACASWALGSAGVTSVDFSTTWTGIQDAEEPLVLHDALCPMTPASFIADCLAGAVDSGTVVVGFHDHEGTRVITSPVVLPQDVVAALADVPSHDFDELVAALEARFPVQYAEAPPAGRRVRSAADLTALEADTTP